jgi:hypothetical protein
MLRSRHLAHAVLTASPLRATLLTASRPMPQLRHLAHACLGNFIAAYGFGGSAFYRTATFSWSRQCFDDGISPKLVLTALLRQARACLAAGPPIVPLPDSPAPPCSPQLAASSSILPTTAASYCFRALPAASHRRHRGLSWRRMVK